MKERYRNTLIYNKPCITRLADIDTLPFGKQNMEPEEEQGKIPADLVYSKKIDPENYAYVHTDYYYHS